MHEYMYGASEISMHTYGAFIQYYSYAVVMYYIRYKLSWISTPALRQKLRIGQTDAVAHN